MAVRWTITNLSTVAWFSRRIARDLTSWALPHPHSTDSHAR